MAGVTWDTSEFDAGMIALGISVGKKTHTAINAIATEILRLSQIEVPHDTGNLQNSGAVENGSSEDEKIVGYNTVYAAFQHEGVRADGSHVITHWQDGRKKKYLEDPIRNNLETFKNYYDGIFDR